MPSPVPSPVAAALGLVPTLADVARRLPARAARTAVHLPVLALSSGLTGLDLVRREYDALADRGERLLDRLRGTGVDELADAIGSAAVDAGQTVAPRRTAPGRATGRLARTADRAADTVQEAAALAAGAAADQTSKGPRARTARQQTASTGPEHRPAERPRASRPQLVGAGPEHSPAERPEAEQAKGAPTPKAPPLDDGRLDSAASAAVVAAVERVADTVPGSPQDPLPHDELPLADYDHMTLGSLRGRMRSLTVEQLVHIRDYEKSHADRLPVVTMLDNRIAKLAADAGPST